MLIANREDGVFIIDPDNHDVNYTVATHGEVYRDTQAVAVNRENNLTVSAQGQYGDAFVIDLESLEE